MNIKVGLAIVFLVANLVGCGNKKSSSGAGPSDDHATPLPNFSVTLEGMVDAGGVKPNVDILFEIGDLVFKTKTGVDGNYVQKLEVDEAHAAIPIKITANIDPGRPKVVLLTILNSVGFIAEQAGADKILTVDENPMVNLSFYTTATFGQLPAVDRFGVERRLDTDEQLRTALTRLELEKTLRIATVLYLSFNGWGFEVPLIDNTLHFASDGDDSAYELAFNRDPVTVNQLKNEFGKKYKIWSAPKAPSGEYIVYFLNGSYDYKIVFHSDFTGVFGQDLKFRWKMSDANSAPGIDLDFDFDDDPLPDEKEMLLKQSGVKSAQILFANDYVSSKRGQLLFYSVASAQRQDVSVSIAKQVFGPYGNDITDCYIYPISQIAPLVPPNLVGKWMQHGESRELLGLSFQMDNQVQIERFVNHSGFIVTDGAAVHTSRQASWSIADNKLVFTSVGGIETYWILEDLGFGYSYLKQTEEIFNQDGVTQKRFTIDKGLLVKQQENLAFKKEDFAGIWLSENDIWVMNGSGSQYVNFGYFWQAWNFDDSENMWFRLGYDGIGIFDNSCRVESVDVTHCELASKEIFLPIAVYGNTYFYLAKSTPYATREHPIFIGGASVPAGAEGEASYSFVRAEKNPKIKYFGRWIESGYPTTFYQISSNGQNVWTFANGVLTVDDLEVKYRFENHDLHYVRKGAARVLRLIAADVGGLRVCEIDEGSTCSANDEFYLSNRRL
ncbi:MAG: hypothetical protein U1F46_04365 [Marinagarivorans sp.]